MEKVERSEKVAKKEVLERIGQKRAFINNILLENQLDWIIF